MNPFAQRKRVPTQAEQERWAREMDALYGMRERNAERYRRQFEDEPRRCPTRWINPAR